MICNECKKFKRIANTDETDQGICTAPMAYTPVVGSHKCIFVPTAYHCADCDRFGNDAACMTAAAEDSAYHNGHICGGFIDKHEANVYTALVDWALRGYNVREKLDEVYSDFQKEFRIPWEENNESVN